MAVKQTKQVADPHTPRRSCRMAAFSLVELLTVVFIISLLIGILIPSINAARTSAKKLTTRKTIDTISVGLELFKNDNGADFRQTNGYAPSFAHPRISGYEVFNLSTFQGRFPFIPEDTSSAPVAPVVYGAHWLPAMLMGVDKLGYVKRSSVPKTDDLRSKPWRWYLADPLGEGAEGKMIDRMDLYLNPDDVPTLQTVKLPGRPPEGAAGASGGFFPDWEQMNKLPVMVDSFGQAILYYAANTHGQPQNMVGDKRNEEGEYEGGPQEKGVPYYFHQDNEGFTGTKDKDGWDYGNANKQHAIAKSGADLTAENLADPEREERYLENFARYIVDRTAFLSIAEAMGLGQTIEPNRPLRPVNADTYLLISAGPDGRYGTGDDVSNLPPWPE